MSVCRKCNGTGEIAPANPRQLDPYAAGEECPRCHGDGQEVTR